MLLVWILTWILSSLHVAAAVALWGWFGVHWILTILMLLFLA
jgi:hypothetical protein